MNRQSHRLHTFLAILVAMAAWLHPAAVAVAADTSVLPAADFPTPERPIHNRIDEVGVEVGNADNHGFNARIAFPEPQAWPAEEGGVIYVQVAIPGMEQAYGPVGLPAIPFYSRLVAVPEGATATIGDVQVTPRPSTIAGIIFPTQDEALDAAETEGDPPPGDDFEDPPFVINQDYYSGDQIFPQQPVTIERLGKVRGLNLYRISIATGRYDPAQKRIQLYASVGVKVQFEGGEGYFLNRRDLLPLNDNFGPIRGMTLNHIAIDQYLDPGGLGNYICFGTEYLIITAPAFRAAADDLKAWKDSKGISTFVVETGNGAGQAGTTATAIQQYIRDRYNDCLIRLSYVLLLGDAEWVPPYYHLAAPGGDLAGTDLDYALIDNADILPDLAVGRIPVDTLTQAQDVVDKTIAYESNPPNMPSFYENATVAGYFQCCRNDATVKDGTDTRSFIETNELVRDELLDEGYTVTRIYTSDTNRTDDPTDPATYYSGDPTPDWYYNSSRLPSDLYKLSGFAWNGNTTNVINAFNAGNFLIIHRDHGSISGWSNPNFFVSNQSSLTNGNLTPIVYSINCASGLYDNETRNPANDVGTYNTSVGGVYFAENLLRIPDGGAVGIIGDVRNSPTWENSALLRGLVDATWPGTVPGNGNFGTSITRLGDILNYGKLYLEGQVGVAQTAGSISSTSADKDVIIYNVYGDPTLEMWTDSPYWIALPYDVIPNHINSHTWQFAYAYDGATITAMQGGLALAQGIVENGVAKLLFVGKRDPNLPIDFVADHPNTLPVKLHIHQTGSSITKEQGGILGAGGNFTATFPSGAVQSPVDIVQTELISPTAPLPSGRQALRSFQVDAEDEAGNAVDHFDQPFQLELCNTDEEFSVDVWEHAAISFFDEGAAQWTLLPTTFNPANGCLTTSVDHLTEFAVLATNPLYLPTLSR